MKNKQEKVKTYSQLYPTVRLGFGSHRTHKLNFINLFNIYYWKSVWYDFKQACLRFTRGYDDSAVYGMDEYLQKFILRGLLYLADNHIGVPSRMSNINKYWEQSNLSFEESDRMWTQKLVDIAENFYESMEWEESKYEKNEFETAFSESFEWNIDDVSGNIIRVLKNGYTDEQVNDLGKKYFRRKSEVLKYKRGQLERGMKRLIEIFDDLWD